MKELVGRIERMNARHVVLIADTCCSGFLTKKGGARVGGGPLLLSDPSRTILAATTVPRVGPRGHLHQ